MKKTSTFLLFWIGAFWGLQAQLSLQPGATWLFRSQIWGVQYGEKWEYVSRSGNNISMRVTVKCFSNPASSPVCQQAEEGGFRTFTLSGDKVLIDGITVADFSLQTGDSTDSPFARGSDPNGGFCDSLRNIPAKVTESGTETVNGISSRYYIIRFLLGLNMEGEPVWGGRKFSEYAWIVNGYWWIADEWIFAPECGIADPYVYRVLVCYYDHTFAAPAVCDQDWFNKMEINETAASDGFSLYPNPAVDVLNVSLPEGNTGCRYQIVSADGRRLNGGSLSGTQVDIAGLAPGLYFLQLQNGSRTGNVSFVKQ